MTKKNINKKQRKTKKRKYGGTPSRLKQSKQNVEAMLSRIKENQEQSRTNTQNMYDYIQRLDDNDPVISKFELDKEKTVNPIYDVGEETPSKKIKNKTGDNSSKITLVKLTSENVNQYIGYPILFKSRAQYTVKNILSVSKTGNSIRIDEPDLGNSLRIATRNVYVIVEPNSASDLKKSKKVKLLYDLGKTDTEPIYDLGQSDSLTPVYDFGQSDTEPIYDLGQTDTEQIYDLGQEKETFKTIVKKTLDKHNIHTREDLIRFCNGSSRKKIYDAVKEDCPPNRCDGKHFKENVRHYYEELLSGFKIHKSTTA